MSKIINGVISGSNGKSTFYTLNGVSIIRSKPGKGGVKQTKATQKIASVFGKASSMVHPLLNELATELNFKMIMKNRGKVVSAAKDWLIRETPQTATSLNVFRPALELNDLVALGKILNVQIELSVAKDNKIAASIGSFNPIAAIKAPLKTDSVEVKVVLITSNQAGIEKYPISIDIPYEDAEVGEQTLQFPVQPEAETVILIGLTLCYKGYRINGMDTDRKWLPAGVLGLGKIG